MWKFERKVDYVEEFFVFFSQIFFESGDFIVDDLAFAASGLEGGGQFVHELASEQVEILMQAFLRVDDHQFGLLYDEQILGNENFS